MPWTRLSTVLRPAAGSLLAASVLWQVSDPLTALALGRGGGGADVARAPRREVAAARRVHHVHRRPREPAHQHPRGPDGGRALRADRPRPGGGRGPADPGRPPRRTAVHAAAPPLPSPPREGPLRGRSSPGSAWPRRRRRSPSRPAPSPSPDPARRSARGGRGRGVGDGGGPRQGGAVRARAGPEGRRGLRGRRAAGGLLLPGGVRERRSRRSPSPWCWSWTPAAAWRKSMRFLQEAAITFVRKLEDVDSGARGAVQRERQGQRGVHRRRGPAGAVRRVAAGLGRHVAVRRRPLRPRPASGTSPAARR